MEDLIEAIKSNDLVAVRKMFESEMAPVVSSLIEARKVEIARSIMIEGEEPDEENESEDDGEDKVEKDEKEADDDEDEEDE